MSGSSKSSTICRAQEAYHRDRAAAAALLANVRAISAKAAIAWAQEATMAEQREAKVERRRKQAEKLMFAEQLAAQHNDRSESENPDRGFAHPTVA